MADTFTCKTCGNHTLQIKVGARKRWRLTCGNGHVVEPVVGTEFVFKTGTQPVPEPEPEPEPEPVPEPPIPVPSATFGPTKGAQAIRDGAGARPVVAPAGIGFASAAELESEVKADPNRTFVAEDDNDWDRDVEV